jgi:hypothetical protein
MTNLVNLSFELKIEKPMETYGLWVDVFVESPMVLGRGNIGFYAQ